MASEPVMENPLLRGRNSHPQLGKIVQDLLECVTQLCQEFKDTQIPLNEDSDTLQRFCAKLEYLLQAEQIVHTSFLGGKKDYWDYFCACLSSVKGVRDGIKYVKSISELKTSLGRGRAFIRFCLVYQRLADSIQQCAMNGKQTSEWYKPNSIWLQHKFTSAIVNGLYDLNSVQFDLAPKGYDLDLSWPSFARKQAGTPYRWNVPLSRTSSMSSLASQDLSSSFIKQDVPATPQTPSSVSESKLDRVERDLDHAESLRVELMIRIEELEKEVEQAHQVAIESEEKLMHTRQEKHELELKHDKVVNQLDMREQAWAEKETGWKRKQQDFNKLIDDLNLKFGLMRSQQDEAVKQLKDTEEKQREKIQELEREKGEMSVNIQRLNQELAGKVEMESRQAEQVVQLEHKLSLSESKYLEIISKMEYLVDEKDSKASSHFDSANKVHELVEKLSSTERINIELRGQNEDLSRKLEVAEKELLQKEEFKTLMAEGLRATEDTLADKDVELSEAHQLNAELDNKLKDVIAEKQDCEKQLLNFKEILEQKEDEQKVTIDQITELSQRCSLKETTEKELETAVEKLSSEKVDLENKVSCLESDIINQEDEFVLEKKEFSNMIENMEKDMAELKVSLNSVQQELQEANANRTKFETKLQASESRNSEERDRMGSTLQQLRDKEEKVTLLENKQRLITQMITLVDGGHFEAQQDLPDELQPIQDKLQQFASERNHLRAQLRNAEAKNSEFKNQVRSLDQKLSEVSQEFNQSQLEAAELKTLISRSQTSEADLQRKLETLSANEELSVQLFKDIEQLKCLVEELEQKNKSISVALNEKEEEILKREASLEEKNSKIQTLLASCETQASELSAYTHQQEVLVSENTDLKGRLGEIESEAVELREEIASVQGNREKLEHQIEVIRNYLSGKSNVNDEDFNMDDSKDSTGILKRFEFLLKWKDKVILNLEDDVKKVNVERDDLNVLYENLQRDCEENLLKMEQLTNDYEKVKTDFEHAEQEKAKDLTKFETLNSAFDAAVAERDEVILEKEQDEKTFSALKVECETLKCAVEQTSNGTQNLIATIQQKDHAISELNETKEKLLKENERLTEQLQAIDEEFAKTKERLEELMHENETLNEKLEVFTAMEEEVEKLKEESKTHTSKVCHLTEEKEELNQSLNLSVEMKNALTETVEKLQQELETSVGVAEELRLKHVDAEEEWTCRNSVLEQELSSVKFQLSSEQLQYETALQGYNAHQEDLSEITEKMSDQEQLIQSLELHLEDIKVERDMEKETKWKELGELQSALEDREVECKMLMDTVKQTGKLLEEEKRKSSELQSQASECQATSVRLQQSNDILTSDNVELKKKLIKLIKDKDSLWQKTDKLEYQQKIKSTEKWIDDDKVKHCMGCKSEFSFMLRKHHCRQCGKIFCYNCSNNWIMTTMSSKKARACNMCYIIHTEGETSTNTELSVTPEDDDISVQIPRKLSSKWDDESRDESANPASTESSPAQGSSSAAALSSSSDSQQKVLPPSTSDKLLNETDDTTSASNSQRDDAPSPTVSGGIDIQGNSHHHTDDHFEEITQEEIARSLSDSAGFESSLTRSLTMSAEEVEQGKAVTDDLSDLWVRAGFAHAVPVLIEKPGIVLCWEFRTEPKSISFSVTYKASENTPEDDAQILIPVCKCNSHRQAVQGELTARQPGLYTLIFDNTASKFTSKKLMYQLDIKTPSEA